MRKNLTFLLCALLFASVFSAWVFVPNNRATDEQQVYRQIAITTISEKYGIDISNTKPTYAVKDDHGNITTWRNNLTGDVSVYVYGTVNVGGVAKNYFIFYSVALKEVVASGVN